MNAAVQKGVKKQRGTEKSQFPHPVSFVIGERPKKEDG